MLITTRATVGTVTETQAIPCDVKDCDKPQRRGRGGWCEGHYKRWYKYGNPLATGNLRPNGLTRDELFIRKVDMTTDPTGCWRWLGKIDKRGKGYGEFTYRDPETGKPKSVPAHRYAYELWVGPIPEGLSIDHVWDNGCRFTDCVNALAHLEPVTPAEQNRRYYGRQTHCYRDHPLSGANLYVTPQGHRVCRACHAIALRAYLDRQIEQRKANPIPLKTHCKNGHEFTPENTRMGGKLGTTRLCRECARIATRKNKAKQLALTSS